MQTGDSGVISWGVIGKRGLGGREDFLFALWTERGGGDWDAAVMSVGCIWGDLLHCTRWDCGSS